MASERWITAYEEAHRACNGGRVKVMLVANGWYRIAAPGEPGSTARYRMAEIVEMTARLEQRAEGKRV